MNISSQAVEIDTNIAGISESPTQLNNRDEAKKSKILLSPSMSLPCSLKLPHQRIFFIFESSLIGFESTVLGSTSACAVLIKTNSIALNKVQ